MNFDPPPPPPSNLSEPITWALKQGTVIHRVWRHKSGRSGNEFNPGFSDADPTRFAPLRRPHGAPESSRVGTLYAGATFATAVYETIFRDLPPRPAVRERANSQIISYAHCELTVQRDLTLASLHHKHLGRWGLSRLSLIECLGKEAYLGTVLWAEAIYDQWEEIDGLVWTSRQDDSANAFLFFGDRVHQADLTPGNTQPFDTPSGRTAIQHLASEDDILITGSSP